MPFAPVIHVVVGRHRDDADKNRAQALAGSPTRPIVGVAGNPNALETVLPDEGKDEADRALGEMSSAMCRFHSVSDMAAILLEPGPMSGAEAHLPDRQIYPRGMEGEFVPRHPTSDRFGRVEGDKLDRELAIEKTAGIEKIKVAVGGHAVMLSPHPPPVKPRRKPALGK
jgi:hypothetical protein